jgi:hypothetical protein
METAKQLYPGAFDDGHYGPWDYTPIIEHCGIVIERHDDNSYQGDTRVLLEANGRFGYLEIGWGSCSGCDSLQACSSWTDLQELIDEITTSVRWFDSKSEALRWFKEHDWAGEYNPCTDFAVKCIAHLEAGL